MTAPALENAESAEDVLTNTEAATAGDSLWARFRRLPVDVWFEPLVILVVGIGFFSWYAATDFTANEDAQLNWSVLRDTIWAHIKLTLVSAAIVLAIAIPLGILLTRSFAKRLTPLAVGIANIGQAAPAVGLLVLFTFAFGTGFRTAVLGLVVYAVLPILQNTITGLRQVDPHTIEASRGIGFSAARTLFQVELPLAVPVILNGVRTALVILVGTATLSTFIGATSLGTLITTGITVFLPKVLITGAIWSRSSHSSSTGWAALRVRRHPEGNRMSRHSVRGLFAVATAAVLTTVLAGCGLISSSGTLQQSHLPDGAKPLEGAPITVTSKAFTEQVILGKIAGTYLAAAGADVNDMTGAPGAASSRQAQLRGETDLQWEYTGTGWVVYHEETESISDPAVLYQKVHDIELADNDLVWLPPSALNNTYAFAASEPVAQRLNVKSLSDVAALPVNERTFCIDDEFFSRSDGFLPMLEAYGIPFDTPDGVPQGNVTRMDSGVIYTSTAAGKPCNFGMVFSTDGRIPNLNLQVLDDDKKFFLPYNGSVVVRKPVLDEHPQIADLMANVSAELDDDTMRDLNGRVDIKGEDPADVAYDWLVSAGLIVPN